MDDHDALLPPGLLDALRRERETMGDTVRSLSVTIARLEEYVASHVKARKRLLEVVDEFAVHHDGCPVTRGAPLCECDCGLLAGLIEARVMT